MYYLSYENNTFSIFMDKLLITANSSRCFILSDYLLEGLILHGSSLGRVLSSNIIGALLRIIPEGSNSVVWRRLSEYSTTSPKNNH